MNQLHESGRSVDLLSNTCLFRWLLGCSFTVLISIIIALIVGTCFLRDLKGYVITQMSAVYLTILSPITSLFDRWAGALG